MEPVRRGPCWKVAWVWVGVLAWALGLRLWVLHGLDLRGMPGPGGVKMLQALALDFTARDWGTWVAGSALPLFGGDVVLAARVLMVAGGLAAALGAMLAAWALGGTPAAAAAGLAAATWSQGVFVSVMLGNDALGWGLAWLGVGASWAAARLGPWGALAVLPGALVALLGAAVKVNAMPAVAFLAVTPLLVRAAAWRGRIAGAALVLAALGVAGVVARQTFLAGHATGQVESVPAVSGALFEAALPWLQRLVQANPEGLVIAWLAAAGLAGALVPAPLPLLGRLPQRLVVGLLAAAVLTYTAATVGVKLRPRYVIMAAFPAVVLGGTAVGALAGWTHRLLGRLHARVAALAWVLPVLVVPALLPDTWAFLHAYANLRVRFEGAAEARLPRPPADWAAHYLKLNQLVFSDTSEAGALDLYALGATAPPAGVLGVPLRDAREFHLTAAAAVAGVPFATLEAQWCCAGRGASADCAQATVDAIDKAGARLVLPRAWEGTSRVPGAHEVFTTLLVQAALARMDLQPAGAWWLVADGSGSTPVEQLPCWHKQPWDR